MDGGKGQTNLRAISIFPWKAHKDNQLSFPKNALITVRKQGDSWWAGELDGRVGWFPRSYVKVIRNEGAGSTSKAAERTDTKTPGKPVALVVRPYVALYAYEGVERGELSFRAKDVIMVTRQEGDWWEGQCNGATGQFPAKYVRPM
jgi:intersectin